MVANVLICIKLRKATMAAIRNSKNRIMLYVTCITIVPFVKMQLVQIAANQWSDRSDSYTVYICTRLFCYIMILRNRSNQELFFCTQEKLGFNIFCNCIFFSMRLFMIYHCSLMFIFTSQTTSIQAT